MSTNKERSYTPLEYHTFCHCCTDWTFVRLCTRHDVRWSGWWWRRKGRGGRTMWLTFEPIKWGVWWGLGRGWTRIGRLPIKPELDRQTDLRPVESIELHYRSPVRTT